MLSGIKIADINKPLNKLEQCELSNNVCHFERDSFSLEIEFERPPIIEEEMFIDFSFSDGYLLQKAWIEGVNMFMGRTPVIQNKISAGEVEALTFLGSCTEPRMQWQMFVEIKNNKTEQIYVYSVLFTTKTE